MSINENIPRYFKLYHKMKQSILRGEFEKGSKIPFINDLAKQYGVSQVTMGRAFDLLEMEGFLTRKRGLGTIIPESANLSPIELNNLIKRNKVVYTLLKSQAIIYSAEWVEPTYRLEKLYSLERGTPDSRIYRVFLKIDIDYSPGLKGLMTQHISENLYNVLAIDESIDPPGVLLKLSEWLETNVTTVKEIMRPNLCMDENAKLLGMPDGTPVFCQEFFVRDKKGQPHFWEFISTANIHSREMQLG
ncbi:MAG: GntR family transcriptional regulator [Syntrophobacteraceae bacterium]